MVIVSTDSRPPANRLAYRRLEMPGRYANDAIRWPESLTAHKHSRLRVATYVGSLGTQVDLADQFQEIIVFLAGMD